MLVLRYMMLRSAPRLPRILHAVIHESLDAIDRCEGPTSLGDGSESFDFVVLKLRAATLCAMTATTSDRTIMSEPGKRTSLRKLQRRRLRLTVNRAYQMPPRGQATLFESRGTLRARKEDRFEARIDLR